MLLGRERDVSAPQIVRSLCFECHARCGVLIEVKDGGIVRVKGDKAYPLYPFETFAFKANGFGVFLVLNIEYPPTLQGAYGGIIQ